MKLFRRKELREAYKYADEGGQALHITKPMEPWKSSPKTPKCFREAELWGHLIDYDLERLKQTAKEFGVKRIKVSRVGQRGQHIDLCGAPLVWALSVADE